MKGIFKALVWQWEWCEDKLESARNECMGLVNQCSGRGAHVTHVVHQRSDQGVEVGEVHGGLGIVDGGATDVVQMSEGDRGELRYLQKKTREYKFPK